MRKSLLILGIMGVIGIIWIKNNQFNFEKTSQEVENLLAIYLEDRTSPNGYSLSKLKTFPKDGYVLNSEKTTCRNGGKITQDPSTKKINLSVTSSDSCQIYFEKEKLPLVQTILKKANPIEIANYEDGNKGEMYTFDHNLTITDDSGTTYTASQIQDWTQEEMRDYRYIGEKPNNWVQFNGEAWRILGVFTKEKSDGTKEQLVKIKRETSIGNLSWDGSGTNKGWAHSNLRTLLNSGDYYKRLNTYASSGLKETAKAQIETVKWYLGPGNKKGEVSYVSEKSTMVPSGMTTSTTTKIALIDLSDYLFTFSKNVGPECFNDFNTCSKDISNKTWLYRQLTSNQRRWTLSTSGSPSTAYAINEFGGMANAGINNKYMIEPALYLKSDLKVSDAQGSQSDPYIIS